MNKKTIYRFLVMSFLFLGLVLILISCGEKKPKIGDNENLDDQSTEFDELFNVSKDNAEKAEDDEADVLKLLGITPQEKAPTEEVVEEPKPVESSEEVKRLEAEIDDKNTELGKLTNELDTERQKVYNLQAQLDTEKNKPKVQQALTPPSGGYRERYRNALDEYNSRKYRNAINQFEQLLASNQTSSLADNCQYWIGESFYALGDYTKAIAAFEKVFSFNNSNKSDDAQLKLGLCYWQENDVSRAKEEFERLLSHYPKSEYVSIARKYLNK